MPIYAGLDVSDKTTHICVVDAEGAVMRRDVVASDPDALARWLKGDYGASLPNTPNTPNTSCLGAVRVTRAPTPKHSSPRHPLPAAPSSFASAARRAWFMRVCQPLPAAL